MKSDEMKLGEQQQRQLHKAKELGAAYSSGTEGLDIYAALNCPPPTTEYPSDRRTDPVERFSLEARLQLMQGLALLGWAAFILELLRV